MPKEIAEDKLKEKLDYIGLNLEKIPKFLKEFTPFSFRPLKSYDDMGYKVYQYVDVTDIEILLTPTDRLTNLNEKYKLSAHISNYLDSESEENIERYNTFLSMLSNTEIEEIRDLEDEQEKLKKQIPYEVKYANNYIWQIYYSDISNKYFMLVPTNEYNNSALFYILKKQIEAQKTRRKEYVFVPISHQEYSGEYLLKSQIADLENYLWYFTKQWPNIFEVYDLRKNMTLKIVGETKVYEKLESTYVISLENKDEALELYKLIKALFIIATGLPEDYKFKAEISENGELNFLLKDVLKTNNKKELKINDNKKDKLNVEDDKAEQSQDIDEKEFKQAENIITYSNLIYFIQNEMSKKRLLIGLEDKKITEEQEKLKVLKEEVQEQTQEYLNRERQISTFLECKKSFIGKVKYYFSNRKKDFKNANKKRMQKSAKKQAEDMEAKLKTNEEDNNKDVSKLSNEAELKQELLNQNNGPYTIEDLIEICTKLDGRRKLVKDLKSDVKAQELKKINLERKIKNANTYLNEIELHKKSIFEFWKFTNKDELPSLNEGEEQDEQNKEKIGKTFDYEEDFEDLGKQVDELQKRKLSKNETDGIFAMKQVLPSIQILNHTKSNELNKEQEEKINAELENLKKSYENDIDLIKAKDFDIFGGMSEDKTKIKMINNQKHREVEKDKYNVLSITPQTEESIYIDNLRNYLKLIKEAFCKIKSPYETNIYLASPKEIELDNLQIFHLSEANAVEKQLQLKEKFDEELGTNIEFNKEKKDNVKLKDVKELYLYKITLPEDTKILYYSNIIFFDNFNQTLPSGMDLSDEVAVDLDSLKLEKTLQEEFNLNYVVDEYTNKIIKINVYEYKVENQNKKE